MSESALYATTIDIIAKKQGVNVYDEKLFKSGAVSGVFVARGGIVTVHIFPFMYVCTMHSNKYTRSDSRHNFHRGVCIRDWSSGVYLWR